MTKRGFSYEQHQEWGAKLKEMDSGLNKLIIDLSHAYRVNGSLVSKARTLSRKLRTLRDRLDSLLSREHPDKEWRDVYYGKRQSHEGHALILLDPDGNVLNTWNNVQDWDLVDGPAELATWLYQNDLGEL